MIDVLIGQVFRLFLVIAVVVLVAQHLGAVLSLLLAVFLMLVIARLVWPSPRR